MDLPIGYDNFRKIIENKLDFVDKSLFIKEIFDDLTTQVIVITRPRRFGKTLNLSMLHHFLASEAYGRSTEGLFNNLKITRAGDGYMQHHRKYPVIFVSFKDVKDHDYQETYQRLGKLLSRVYLEHGYLLSSPKLMPSQKIIFESILEERATSSSVQSSLLDLAQALYQHHGIEPWLLIDEYDTPLQSSYVHGYYQKMVDLFRGLFGTVLKTNPYLNRAVITGILRISKESLFSDVNNLKIYSVLSPRYSEYFGFTEPEMTALIKQAHMENDTQKIKDWYNGYQIGETILYNPWSIVNCFQDREFKPYWINTSGNQLIRTLLIESSQDFKENFEVLLQDKPLTKLINENIVFGDLKENEIAVWSLLLMAGYLKVVSQAATHQGISCILRIPNNEVKDLFRQIIEQWLANGHGIEWYNKFLNHLLTGDFESFERELKELMQQTVSHHDTAKNPEAFYHGLMIGLTASLFHHKNYELKSNRESGYGRYDYLIFSRDNSKPSVLLEFKKIEMPKNADELATKLEEAALDAILQIDKRNYLAEAKQRGSTQVLKVGLAFCGKHFKLCHVMV